MQRLASVEQMWSTVLRWGALGVLEDVLYQAGQRNLDFRWPEGCCARTGGQRLMYVPLPRSTGSDMRILHPL
jgi:hypothetical protein